jgi:hypothetical protein
MTIASITNTAGKAFKYTGQCIISIQNFGIFTKKITDTFSQLKTEEDLRREIILELSTSALLCGVSTLLKSTISMGHFGAVMFLISQLHMIGPIIALVGLGLSYLGQKLEGKTVENRAVAL